MSSSNGDSNISNYNSAAQWADKYSRNPNGIDDNSINIFWISIIILLILVAAWWWWTNYRSHVPANKYSQMEDLKSGAQIKK